MDKMVELIKPPSPENTARIPHKLGNKNNVKEECIQLIFSNIYSNSLFRFYLQKWHNWFFLVLFFGFFFFFNKSGVERLPDYPIGIVIPDITFFFHIFQASNVKFKLMLTNYFSSFIFLWHKMIILLQLPYSKLVKYRIKKNK